MFKFKKNRDRGDAGIISLVIALPIVLMILFTLIDSGIYFMNSQSISSAARDGARTVAIFGGNGNATKQTTIEKAYGQNVACTADAKAKTANKTTTECGIYTLLNSSNLLTGVKVNKISCTPTVTTSGIGQDVKCSVDWEYSGIPGSSMGFIKGTDGKSPFQETTTTGTARSEVQLTTSDLVNR